VPNQLLVTTPQATQWAVPSGQESIGPFTITGSLGNAEVFTIAAMANGDNTFAVPAGCRGVVIIPPSGNTTPITYREVGGDTGSRIDKTAVKVEIFDTAALPANVIINSTGGFAGPLTAIFF
jgi:hypothetical protein